MSLLFNMLSRLVITFLPRREHLLMSWLQSPSAVISDPKRIKSSAVSNVSPSISHEVISRVLIIKQNLNKASRVISPTWRHGILPHPSFIHSLMFLSNNGKNESSRDRTKRINWNMEELLPVLRGTNKYLFCALENWAVATGMEKVNFHSNPKERQCLRMFKLLHNCTDLTC